MESLVMGQKIDDVLSSLRQRIEDLSEQVRLLSATVDELGARVRGMSRQTVATPASIPESLSEPLSNTFGIQRFHASTFLSTTATVCFLLVIALVLRMASDNGVINYQFGAFLGLVYAFALFVVAHIRYSRARRAIPVYSTCAALMVFAIIIENHAQFSKTFEPLPYVILAAGSLVMILLGVLHSIPTLIGLGTLGVSLIAVAAGFPNPNFPFAALLILLANIAVCVRVRLAKCGWMSWGMLAATLVFWFTWTVRLAAVLHRGEVPAPALASHWFFPLLAGFVAWYLFLSVRNALRPDSAFHGFETALPILTVAWSYMIARSVAGSGFIPSLTLGAVGLVVAACLVGFAFVVASHRASLTRETMSFIVAGLLLCSFSLLSVVSQMFAAVLVWCIIGFSLAVLSFQWQSGTLRGISYLVQVYACGVALFAASLLSLEPFSILRVGVALTMAGLCFGHYIWVRQRTPADRGHKSSGIDLNDRAAIVPLLIAVIGAFATARMLWYALSSEFESEGAFQSGQSVMINSAAILLSEVGLVKKNGEFLVVAAIVAVIGAVKVFAFDFFHIQDLPLVISVFSFGLMAALGAVIWKRWQGAIT
jgi:hypothetical protein